MIKIINDEMPEDEMKDMYDNVDKNINEDIPRHTGGIITVFPDGVVELRHKRKAEIVRLSLKEKKEKNQVEMILELVEKNF